MKTAKQILNRFFFSSGFITLALITLCMSSCHKKTREKKHRPTPKVYVEKVTKKNLPIVIDSIGHFRGYNEVAVKAQIEGVLEKVFYTQGDFVRQGELLLVIDPSPYQAALKEAEAMLKETEVNLRFAMDKVARYETLVTKDYVSQLDYDQFVTNVAFYEAQLMQNQAAVEKAKINLGYCFIRAPFSGRVGIRLVDEGNLIQNDGSTMLYLTQVQPTYIDFPVSERDLAKILKYNSSANPLEVRAIVPDDDNHVFIGKLAVVNNIVDQKTGMINLRAEIPNDDLKAWPGQFIRARLILYHKPNSLMVPVAAINTSQKGQYVYVVNNSNEAEVHRVQTGERLDNMIEVIKGVEEGERVIIQGQINVRPNTKVEIVKRQT